MPHPQNQHPQSLAQSATWRALTEQMAQAKSNFEAYPMSKMLGITHLLTTELSPMPGPWCARSA